MKRYDLAVIGGGFAGAAAALAAARGGAKVLLVEKANCLGGAAANCLVNPFMPYWTEMNGERVDLSAGIFREIHLRLQERGAMLRENFLEEELKLVLNDMMAEANVDLLFHAYIFKVDKTDKTITSVTVATKAGEIRIEADYFIDATGLLRVKFYEDENGLNFVEKYSKGEIPDYQASALLMAIYLNKMNKQDLINIT